MEMRRLSLCIGALLLPAAAARSQEPLLARAAARTGGSPARQGQSLPQSLIDGLLEQSYVTFFSGIAGNGPDLIFEGNIAPAFYVSAANRLLVVGTPKVVLRMLDAPSFPVRTPSYMPRLAIFLRLLGNQFLTVSASHYSNGQEDSTFLADGSLNLRSGNFRTNFVEGGLQGAIAANQTSGSVLGYRLAFEYHPSDWMDDDIRNLYPPRRLHVGLEQLFQVHRGIARLLGAEMRFTEDVTWYMGGVVPDARRGPSRLGGWYSVSFKPSWLQELTIFINAYVGPDYYNIHFLERLSVLRIGLGTRRSAPTLGPAIRAPS
jgi:hypothetical protein